MAESTAFNSVRLDGYYECQLKDDSHKSTSAMSRKNSTKKYITFLHTDNFYSTSTGISDELCRVVCSGFDLIKSEYACVCYPNTEEPNMFLPWSLSLRNMYNFVMQSLLHPKESNHVGTVVKHSCVHILIVSKLLNAFCMPFGAFEYWHLENLLYSNWQAQATSRKGSWVAKYNSCHIFAMRRQVQRGSGTTNSLDEAHASSLNCLWSELFLFFGYWSQITRYSCSSIVLEWWKAQAKLQGANWVAKCFRCHIFALRKKVWEIWHPKQPWWSSCVKSHSSVR